METYPIDQSQKCVSSHDQFTKFDEILRHMQAPPVELEVFSGNVIDYPHFIATFTEVVESTITNPRGRLIRLIKYLKDEAKELAESCNHLPPEEGYQRAKNLLDKQYGDRYRILSQYRQELKQWPKLKSNDAKGFRRFYSFLMKYKATMLSLKSPFLADNPEIIQKLQLILPPHLQERWNRKSYQVRKNKHTEAGLDEFISFVDEETALINDPNYSRLALQDFKEDSPTNRPGQRKGRDFKTFKTSPLPNKCLMCEEQHDLDQCERYLRLSINERRKWLYQRKLCFACYRPSTDAHQARSCTKKRKCDTCKGDHPTGLHGYRRRPRPPDRRRDLPENQIPQPDQAPPPPINVSFAKLNMEVTSLNVVLVRISHPSSDVVVVTKALLDNGSQGTFIHERLLDQLNVQSTSTEISIQTMNGITTEPCQAINNLEVSSFFNDKNKIQLPRTFSRSFIPVDKDEIPSPSKLQQWTYLDKIHPYLQQDDDDLDVGILIGGNCPRALEPIEVIPCQDDGPYAFRSTLGWCVTGPIATSSTTKSPSRCNFIAFSEDKRPTRFVFEDKIKESGLKEAMLQMLQIDFTESTNPGDLERMSIDDKQFLDLMDKKVKFVDGHYELPLPFKDPNVKVPNNRIQAVKRARSLKRKLQKDKKMHEDYCAFMNKLFAKSYAKQVTGQSVEGKTWYLPHHGVYHPKKPEKIRVVFDCSATYDGFSLNSMLLQGPDLTNQIVGVLSRFRGEQIALVADIESMFYQVKVPIEQQDMLRFVWWPEGDLDAEPQDFMMCVHLFGGTHSPSTCNYALRRTAIDNESKFGKEASSTLFRNFYVDDMLKGSTDIESTIKLQQNVRGMCAAGGFNLTQFMSSSRDVLDEIPDTIKAKGIKDVDLSIQSLPIERALGVSWCVETDSFCFRIVLKDTPLTRRGILASISSVYDPLGFGAPFVLPAKQLLQQICSERKSWDDEISSEQRHVWEKWRNSLHLLEEISIQRCIVPSDFGEISEVSFHHFSDASMSGYGQVSYVRLVNSEGRIHCSFVIGKARVAPLKPTTVPRLELTAATTSTKVATQLKKEMTLVPDFETFWTDSKVVLGYIANTTKKFHLFVTNRIQAIHDASHIDQWRYVPTDDNPADDGSRGTSVKEFVEKQRWINGPDFLWKPLDSKSIDQFSVSNDDVEVKKLKPTKINLATIAHNQFELLFKRVSRWYRLKRIIALMLSWRFKKKVDVDLLLKAELAIVRLTQKMSFPSSIDHVKKGMLSRMDPFIDDDGIIRVGGRITNSTLPWKLKHPVILPKKHPVSVLIIRHFHEKIQHGGRDATLNEIRQHGFMIINANSRVRNEIFRCVMCRRFRGKFGEQKMANLPTERCSESAPFTYSGVDMFGPFIIKQGRKEFKRYVALFTCFASRAIHLESTATLDTDSFIMALRRFINRRGDVRQIRSDNGSNFIGADAELKKAIKEMDDVKINDFLLRNNIDWMGWDFNTPTASHMGGVWERQIRSCRSILSSLLKNHSQSLNDESFNTVLTEVETIVNSRPLSVEVLSDGNSLVPLTPNLLLTSKMKIVMAPPGNFTEADIYSRRRWRRVQHLVNEFWSRWRSEYLQSLQQRRKWDQPKRNFIVGDVVLIKDESSHRNDWRLGRITSVKKGDDENVRSVVVQTSTHKEYERPIAKIVLLVEADEISVRIPVKEPSSSE